MNVGNLYTTLSALDQDGWMIKIVSRDNAEHCS